MNRLAHFAVLTAVVLGIIFAIALPGPDLPISTERFQIQETRTDCGPASLHYVLKHFNIETTVAQLRQLTGESGTGTSMLDLKRAAESFGLTVQGWKVAPMDLGRIECPAIVLLEGRHFSILTSIETDHLTVVDPAHGKLRMSHRLFLDRWSGYTLVFSSGDRPQRSESINTTPKRRRDEETDCTHLPGRPGLESGRPAPGERRAAKSIVV